ncbi:MAG TPA: hypothetical protein VNH13_02700 [Candidatus Acidoferrales bacterium]|nr:hypothetical protein [Candidatus Acidoferrales bacterium]
MTTTAGVSTVQCTGGGVATRHLHPASDNLVSPSSLWNIGGPGKVNGGGNKYLNMGGKDATHDDTAVDPSGTALPAPPTTQVFPSSPTANSYVYSTDGQSSSSGQGYRVTLSSPNGSVSASDFLYARYVTFKTTNGVYDSANGGYGVTVTVAIQDNASGSWVTLGVPVSTSATGTITAYQTPAIQGSDLIAAGDPAATHLSLLVTVGTTAANPAIRPRDPSVRGAGISWSEAYLDHDPVPPPPPMIPPGLYRSILIPDETGVHGCAILDPTAYYGGGLKQYQMPGVYYFKDASGGGKNAQISIGDNSFLIGDGVTLVFDSNWPDPTGTGGSAGAHGIQIGSSGALIVNSGISGGYNPSDPLSSLPHDALSAAWQVDPTNPSTGISSWGGPCTTGASCTVPRASYIGQSGSDRGVSFYFKPKTNGSTDQADFDILGRFSMGGNVAGISFRGILYAPFDDVQISGANGFDTVGMVLAWTAKFNGGSASINLDYPYDRIEAPPYLLEPGVTQ